MIKRLSISFLSIFLFWTCSNGSSPTGPNQIQVFFKTFGGTSEETGRSIQQTADGGFIFVGQTWRNSYGLDDADIYIAKTDYEGNIEF